MTRLASVLLLVPTLAVAQTSPSAAAVSKSGGRALPGSSVELKTQDGWTLSAQYSPARDSKPTFILLHDAGGRKENWYFLAHLMARHGIGVLALDLRGHGDSQNPPPGQEGNWRKFRAEKNDSEWDHMLLDAQAAVDYLKSQNVPENLIALGGADLGANIALRYAAIHPAVPMGFLLSPGFDYRGVLAVNAMRAWGHRPILIAVAEDDRRCLLETAVLFQIALNGAGPENARRLDAQRGHGTRMLIQNKGLISQLTDWMEHPQVPPEVAASTAAAVVSSGTIPAAPTAQPPASGASSPQ